MGTKRTIHPLTAAIHEEILAAARITSKDDQAFVQRYLGTTKRFINLSPKNRDKIIKDKSKALQSLSPDEALQILDELIYSDLFDCLNIAGKILSVSPQLRQKLPLMHIRDWMLTTQGWAECDCICQSCFTGEEVVERFEEWQSAITSFAKDEHIQVRRSSLVLQVKPARQTADKHIRALAFATASQLSSEKHILITKAVSWILRSLVAQDKEEVRTYIEKNKPTLPAIAYRETMKKILTGRKNDRPLTALS